MSIELDKETEAYLVEILGTEKTTSDELIERLVKERWLSLQPCQTIVKDWEDIPNICYKMRRLIYQNGQIGKRV